MDCWRGRPRGVGFYPPLAEAPNQIKDQRMRANCNWSADVIWSRRDGVKVARQFTGGERPEPDGSPGGDD